MARALAVLIEDDDEQAEVTRRILEEANFGVVSFSCAADAEIYLADNCELVDLFVLDRKLPQLEGERPSEVVGDGLLNRIRDLFTDSRIVSFTGFASVEQLQGALGKGGTLPKLGDLPGVHRVSALRKDQLVDFRDLVREYGQYLDKIANVELIPRGESLADIDQLSRRCLRRLAAEYGGKSLIFHTLSGGLTNSKVWSCEIHGQEGLVARIVAKTCKNVPAIGGLIDVLPHDLVAAKTQIVQGMMNGVTLSAMQFAGANATSLFTQLPIFGDEGEHQIEQLKVGLRSVQGTRTVKSICEVAAPLACWADIYEYGASRGMEVPSSDLNVMVTWGQRHRDLHPGNVLIANGRPVLIDFDSQGGASEAIDPVVLLLSSLVHPDSPIKGEGWPEAEEIEASFGTMDFGDGHPSAGWFRCINRWALDATEGGREYWALVLAYCVRQIGYPDVQASPEIMHRVEKLAALSASRLRND